MTGQVVIMKELIYIKMFLFAHNNISIVETKIVECKYTLPVTKICIFAIGNVFLGNRKCSFV